MSSSLKRIPRKSIDFRLPRNVTKVYEIVPEGYTPGAFRQAVAEAKEGSLVAILLHDIVVVFDPLSDPELLFRDALKLNLCKGVVIGPRSTEELDPQLDNLSRELTRAGQLMAKLRRQLLARVAELNDELGNPLSRLPD